MNTETENLVLEHPRRIRDGQDLIRENVRDLKLTMTSMEEGIGHLREAIGLVHVPVAGQNKRIDRGDERMARIERRFDLGEARA